MNPQLHLLLSRRKSLLLSGMAFAFVSGIFNLFFSPDIFEARSTVMPSPSRSKSIVTSLVSASGGLQLGGLPSLGMKGDIRSELEDFRIYLNSDEIVKRAYQRLKSHADLPSEEKAALDYLKDRFFSRVESPAFRLSFRSESRDLAQKALEAYMAALQEILNQSIVTKSKSTVHFLSSRLSEIGRSIEESEKNLSDLKSGRIAALGSQGQLTSIIKRKERQILGLDKIFDNLKFQEELSRIEAGRSDPLFLVIDDAAVLDDPVSPRRLLNIITAFWIGVLGAFVFLMIRNELMREMIH